MHTAYIALGSNLASPIEQLKQALQALKKLEKTELVSVSSFYQSKPLGPQDQPDFINAVVEIATSLEPIGLLDNLQAIEQAQGRERKRHWGERTLDLDILLYDDREIKCERLTIPHYDMCNREFVIVPLFEIAPDLVLPNGEKLSNLAFPFIHEKKGNSMVKLKS